MRIIFFGTPEFAIPPLRALIEADFEIVGVFTENPKPVGRHQEILPSPVKIFAEKNNLPVFAPESLKSSSPTSPFFKGGGGDFWAKKIEELNPDLAVVAAYGQILPKELLEIPKYGFINIHPSLLPKYRGASPVQSAILNGERETGVTIMLMDEKMDHGQILAQEKISIGDDEDTPALLARTAELGAEMLPQTIKNFVAGKIKPQEQNHEAATFSKILKKEDGKIDWNKSATEIPNRIRAFRPWPGTWSMFRIKNYELRIKILDGIPSAKNPPNINIGDFFVSPPCEGSSITSPPYEGGARGGNLAVKCGRGSLVISKLQPEGKKEMTGEEFMRGYLK